MAHGTRVAMAINSSTSRQGRNVVWVAFVVAVFGWGVGFYGPAVYLPVLHPMHGWSISPISSAITAHYLVSAVLIANLPTAYRRFGIAPVTMAGAVFAGVGAIAWANAAAAVASRAGAAAERRSAGRPPAAPRSNAHGVAMVRASDRPKAISMAFNGASVGGMLVHAAMDGADRAAAECRLRQCCSWRRHDRASSARWPVCVLRIAPPAAAQQAVKPPRASRTAGTRRLHHDLGRVCARPVRPDRPLRAPDRAARRPTSARSSPRRAISLDHFLRRSRPHRAGLAAGRA